LGLFKVAVGVAEAMVDEATVEELVTQPFVYSLENLPSSAAFIQ
jgi:hypothetical protein